jgi:hypothetical protein
VCVFRHHNLRNELFKDLREQLKDTSKCAQQQQQQQQLLGQWLAALACRQRQQQDTLPTRLSSFASITPSCCSSNQ